MASMNICVIGGAGYVGLVTGLCLSQLGHQVINVDVDRDRISMLQAGECPIYEKGLASILNHNLDAERIQFSTELARSVTPSQIVFIAVGTPSQDDGRVDLTQITEVAQGLVACLDDYKLLVMKSTVPVGTIDLIRTILGQHKREGSDFDIVVNPEFCEKDTDSKISSIPPA